MAENSTGSAKKRGPGKPFQSGQSGNPGGRPKAVGYLRELAQRHADTAVNALVDIVQNSDKDSARVAAAQVLLDRGFGRVPAQEELQREDDGVMSQINDEHLIELTAAAMAAIRQDIRRRNGDETEPKGDS